MARCLVLQMPLNSRQPNKYNHWSWYGC